MTFEEYFQTAIKTAQYPDIGANLVYPAMGLSGEAGEVCDKVKKMWRNTGNKYPKVEFKKDIVLEMGDVLWYLAAMCMELGISLEIVAQSNIAKLKDRANRNVIKSSGDNR